ncbi:MAG: signal peptide peptidase SppA [Halodesulfurarchaeum sp.]
MDSTAKRLGRIAVVLAAALLAAALGWILFVRIPGGDLGVLLGIVLTIGLALVGIRFTSGLATSLFPPYNVARVSVEGPIVRRAGGMLPSTPTATPADAIVEQIERADEDTAVDALVLQLNTPGGEVVPSEDIRSAAEAFEGPTIAYATDTCASGGYWIASGCDHIYARSGSIVGSIGVLASRVTAADLLDKVGLTYERLVAGEYKDAGMGLREMDEDDRAYLQGIVNGYYDEFVDRVTAGRDLDADAVRETEARVYLGEEAKEQGLVDSIGDMDAVEEHLQDELDESVTVSDFEPETGLTARIRGGAQAISYAFGAGITKALAETPEQEGLHRFRFR